MEYCLWRFCIQNILHILFVTRFFSCFFFSLNILICLVVPLFPYEYENDGEWLLFFLKKVVKKQLVYDKNRVAGMGKASYLHLKIKSKLQLLTGIDPEAFLNVNSYSVKILSKKGRMKPFPFFSYHHVNWWTWKLKFAHINGQKIAVITFLKCFVKKYKAYAVYMGRPV